MANLTCTLSTLVLAACVAAPAFAKDTSASAEAKHPPGAASMPGAPPEKPVFSVDMIINAQGQTFTMRRTVDHEKTRMDMKSEDMEATQIVLGDEAGTTYLLMPEQKQAMKSTRKGMEQMMGGHTPEELGAAKDPTAKPEASQIDSLGIETIDGRPAQKFRLHYGDQTGTMWVDAGSNMPVRMESEGATVEFRNYDFSQPPRSAFEVPKGYQVMDMDEMMAKMKSSGMAGSGQLGALMGGMSPTGMAKGYAGNMAGSFAGGIGGGFGASLGAMVGGPIGAMVGQYVGQKIGQKIGSKVGTAAAGAVLPGK
jgi:hypothetical protein